MLVYSRRVFVLLLPGLAVLAVMLIAETPSARVLAQPPGGCPAGGGPPPAGGAGAGANAGGASGVQSTALQQVATQMMVQAQMQATIQRQRAAALRHQALTRLRAQQQRQRQTVTADVGRTERTTEVATGTATVADDRWSHLRQQAAERRNQLDERIERQRQALAARRTLSD